MTLTKLLIGQILIVFAILVAGVWAEAKWCGDAGLSPHIMCC